MSRKPAVIYTRQTLDTPALIESVCLWAKRKGFTIREVVVESNEKQPKLRRLLRQSQGVVIIAPDVFHFAEPAKVLPLLAAARSVVFVQESLVLNRHGSPIVFKLAQAVAAAGAKARSYRVRESLMLSRLIGKRIGRPALPDEVCERAIALLKAGKSLRGVAREVGISKSAVQRLARTLKK